MAQSLLQQAKELEQHIGRILSAYDVLALAQAEQKTVATLKSRLIDVRLDARDYELVETRAEQLKLARAGRARIDELQKSILGAGEHRLLSAADVAHLSALAENIRVELI